ncbi:MAG: transposase [Desulfobacteraceae bacterium]|nr:transposase [Desulfobacteraceae bacterium]
MIKSAGYGKNQNRRLSAWTKSITAEALKNVSHRRSSAVHLINAAYTSQICSRCGSFGKRNGELQRLQGCVAG